jgi:hypothetical protein
MRVKNVINPPSGVARGVKKRNKPPFRGIAVKLRDIKILIMN